MAATIVLSKARAVRTISGGPQQILHLPEAGSLGVKIGEFVYLAAGLVTEIGDNPTAILGMAAADGQNTTAALNQIPVIIANSDTIFELNKVDASGAVHATANADVGMEFALYRDTSGNMTHAIPCPEHAHNPRLMCIDHSGFDNVGDLGGRLLCMVMGTYRQLFSTS